MVIFIEERIMMTTDDSETELSGITIESHRTRASNDGDESVFRIGDEHFRRLDWVLRARAGKGEIRTSMSRLHVEIDNGDATTLVCTDGRLAYMDGTNVFPVHAIG